VTSTRNVRVRDSVNAALPGENRRLTGRLPTWRVARSASSSIQSSTFTRATIALALFKRTCSPHRSHTHGVPRDANRRGGDVDLARERVVQERRNLPVILYVLYCISTGRTVIWDYRTSTCVRNVSYSLRVNIFILWKPVW